MNLWPITQAPPYFDRFAILGPETGRRAYLQPRFNFNGTVKRVGRYATDVIGRRAVNMLKTFNRNQDDRPWLMYVTPFAPHAPSIPASRHIDARVPTWNPAPSVFEKDRSDKPPAVRAQHTDLDRVRESRRQMLRTLMSVDEMVNRLMNLLRETGEATRTMVFFLSDNGYLWGEHRLALGKRFPYVESTRVPFYMRWPGHTEPGTTEPRTVANIDIAPTVLGALGLSSPVAMDGRSLLSPDTRTRMLTEFFGDAHVRPWASTWTPDWQYVEWYDSAGVVTFREYYDLRKDPYQMVNRLRDANPANDPPPERLAEIQLQLQQDRECSGPACP